MPSGRERGQARDRGCLASSDWWARSLCGVPGVGCREELKGAPLPRREGVHRQESSRGHKDGCGEGPYSQADSSTAPRAARRREAVVHASMYKSKLSTKFGRFWSLVCVLSLWAPFNSGDS